MNVARTYPNMGPRAASRSLGATANGKGSAAQACQKMPGKWEAFWCGFTIFCLGRDRFSTQYPGWQTEYAQYFRIHASDEAARA